MNSITLTPEELYYLAGKLQAKYIDYAYVAAMTDVTTDFSLYEKETSAALVKKGILREDFSGNREIDEAAVSPLLPVFFGDTETSLDICRQDGTEFVKYHFHDGAITAVRGDKEGALVIAPCDGADIARRAESLLPENYTYAEKTVTGAPPDVTRLLLLKRAVAGRSSAAETYVEAGGLLYRDEGNDTFRAVDGDEFVAEAREILKGV